MVYTADTWPITAAPLQFPHRGPDGVSMQEAEPTAWENVFREIQDAGFDNIDLLDTWIRIGDLSGERLDELQQTAEQVGIGAPSVSAIRCSVIDERNWEENLAYSHRTLDAAAQLGCEVVSFGLQQPLTPLQKEQLWFWTVDGHKDPANDPETWQKAVERLRELGNHAAEVGLLMSLELYEDTYLGSGDSAVRLVEEIGLPNVGLNPDLGNLVRAHRPIEPIQELVAKTMPYANYWHVKNYARDENLVRGQFTVLPAPLETGVINYREAVRIALASGFQGIICAEHYGGDGLSISATNQEYLRKKILPRNEGYALGTPRVAQGRQKARQTTG